MGMKPVPRILLIVHRNAEVKEHCLLSRGDITSSSEDVLEAILEVSTESSTCEGKAVSRSTMVLSGCTVMLYISEPGTTRGVRSISKGFSSPSFSFTIAGVTTVETVMTDCGRFVAPESGNL